MSTGTWSTGTWSAPLLHLRWQRCSYSGVVIFHHASAMRKGELPVPGTKHASVAAFGCADGGENPSWRPVSGDRRGGPGVPGRFPRDDPDRAESGPGTG